MLDQDVSRIVMTTVVEWRGQRYLLDNFGFDDWSAIQSKLVRDKRARMIQAGYDAAKLVQDQHLAKKIEGDAISRAGDVTGLTPQELQNSLNSESGAALALWCMFERRYPGKLSIEDVGKMARDGAIDEAKGMEIFGALMFAMGHDPGKKKIGQSSDAAPTSPANS